MKTYKLFKIVFMMLLSYQFTYADAILLNEYNAVAPEQQLKNEGYDTHYGDIYGNGGDWIELVVIEDYLDLRDAIIDIKRYNTQRTFFTASFPNITQLAYLRKGTIITISQEPTDISYDPINDDWSINLNVNSLTNIDGLFDITNNTMGISILSNVGSVLMQNTGEFSIGGGISDQEVFKLKKEPSSSIQPNDSAYGDDNDRQIISSFGSPNQWIISGDVTVHQNFDNIRDIDSSINSIILLNEYDAVASNKRLKGDGNDTYFGQVDDNGGSWIEIVILKDKNDLRGAEIKVHGKHSSNIFRATFPDIEALSKLRSGTILTISDEVATDLSYDPFNQYNPDWNINIHTDDLITLEGDFFTNNLKLLVSMRSGAGGVTIMPEMGEGIFNTGIDDREVFKLKKDPSTTIIPSDSAYGDDNEQKALSTFGNPNHWKDDDLLIEQDFENLRLVAMKNNFYKEQTSLVLNEYNAVASNQYLKGGGEDKYFGVVEGNGGSWLEMIVTKDYLDLRNATIVIKENALETFSAKIPEFLSLGYLRKGTIITISNEFTDMSYAPFAPNSNGWRLNIDIDDLINPIGTLALNDNNIDISILSTNGTNILSARSGEGIWNPVVDSQEVYKLKSEPNKEVTPFDSSYGDDSDSEVISTFSSANSWRDINGTVQTQKLTLQKNRDLIEIDGIVTANIEDLNLRDGEALLYISQNNSLWIADDSSHRISEIDFTTKEIKTIFDDEDFGLFASDIQDECHDKMGICDIEGIAYDENNDTMYVLVGDSSSTSAIFRLTRENINDTFVINDYKNLNGMEYPAAIFINGDFIVSIGQKLYKYNYETNQIIGDFLYETPKGTIVGLAYTDNTLLVTTSDFELLKVNWITKGLQAQYNMHENGVYDPRGIEIINNRLYILDGVNSGSYDTVTAPFEHPLKGAIHIYESNINGFNPIVTLEGNVTQTINLNGTYVEAGAIATDIEDGSVNVNIGGDEVDTTTIGAYSLTYTAVDSDGNSDIKTRMVYVIDPTIIYTSVPNDYPTIKDAIANANDGDLIILEPGVHRVYEEISIFQNNLTIASRYHITNDESFISSTIIKGDNDRTVDMFEGKRGNTDANSISFIGLTIKQASKFIRFVYGDNNLIDHCIIKDIRRDAISFDGSATGSVTYCTIENAGDDGIDVDTKDGENGGGFEFAYNTITNSGDDGIEIHLWYYQDEERINPTMHFNIHHNTIKDSSKDGIQLIDFDKTQDGDGVEPNDAIDYPTNTNRTFEIHNNIIKDNGQVGVGAIFQFSQHIDGSRPESKHFSGANMGEYIYIHDNTFRSNDYHILGGDNMNVENNEFVHASTVALKRVKGNSVINTNNTFSGNAQDFEDCNN